MNEHGQDTCVVTLLQYGANMLLPGIDGGYPIHRAASHNRASVVSTLLRYGCDKNLVSINTITNIYTYINITA